MNKRNRRPATRPETPQVRATAGTFRLSQPTIPQVLSTREPHDPATEETGDSEGRKGLGGELMRVECRPPETDSTWRRHHLKACGETILALGTQNPQGLLPEWT